ncbi:MAG: hypothetical protein ACHQK8_07645, partial [Bacteroidia bacterium]
NNNNNNNNPPKDSTYKDSSTILINGVKDSLNPATCSLSGGSSNFYTMTAYAIVNSTTYLQITTHFRPTVSDTFHVTFGQPVATNDIQIWLKIGGLYQYTATSGTALVTVSTAVPPTGIKVSFSKLVLTRTGNPSDTTSAVLICQ